MNIFITGGSGFVGSFLLRKLISETDHKVAILSRGKRNNSRISGLIRKVVCIDGDLANPSAFEAELKLFNPEVVVHLAWEGVIGSERNSKGQWRNVCHTMQLIELSHKLGAKKFIGLGSQAEYGPCSDRIDENQKTSPTTLYGASKLATFIMSQRMCSELKMKHVWLRLFSSFGPGDNESWLIPYVIKTLLDNKKPALTRAEQIWDYIYVEDVASAILSVLKNEHVEGLFNLGSGSASRLADIIEMVRDAIDPQLELGFGEQPYRPDQVMHLEANIERLTNATGWEPICDLKTSILETVNWHIKQK